MAAYKNIFFNINNGLVTASWSDGDAQFKWSLIRQSDNVTLYDDMYDNGSQSTGIQFNVTPNINETYKFTLFTPNETCIDERYDYDRGGYYCHEYQTKYDSDGGTFFSTTKVTTDYSWGTPSFTGSNLYFTSKFGSSGTVQPISVTIYKDNYSLAYATQSGSTVSFVNLSEGDWYYITTITSNLCQETIDSTGAIHLNTCILQSTVFTPTQPSTSASADGNIFVNWTSNGALYTVQIYKGGSIITQINNVHSRSQGYNFSGLSSGSYTVVIFDEKNSNSCKVTSSSIILQGSTRYYMTLPSGNAYYSSCPIPTPTISQNAHTIAVNWLPEGAENGNTTTYDVTVTSLSGNSQVASVIDTNTTNRTVNFTASIGVSYTIKVRANCKDSSNSVNTSGWSTLNYTLPYYYHNAAVGVDYLEVCPMVDMALGVDSNNTLYVWFYAAGQVNGSSASRYNISVYDSATGSGLVTSNQFTAPASGNQFAVGNLQDYNTYRVEIQTVCDTNTLSTVRSQTITPLNFSVVAIAGTVDNPNPSITLTTKISGVKVAQVFNSITTNSIISGTSTSFAAQNGVYKFTATDPNNPNNTKQTTVNAVSCTLQANALAITAVQPAVFGLNGGVNASINNSTAIKRYTLSAPGFATIVDNIYENTYTKNNLPANNYTLRVEQGNNNTCFLEKTFIIWYCDLTIASVGVVNPTTYGGSGTATVYVDFDKNQILNIEIGFVRNGSNASPIYSTSSNSMSVVAGSWTAYARYKTPDGVYFCEATKGFTVTEPSSCNLPTQPNLVVTNQQFFGGTGSVTSDMSAYRGAKVYRVRDPQSVAPVDYLSTPDFRIAPGNYVYEVTTTDIADCTRSIPFTIADAGCNITPDGFTVTATPRSYSATDGTITISPQITARGNFVYTISGPGSDTNPNTTNKQTFTTSGTNYGRTFTGLRDGLFTVAISYDGTSCSTTKTVTINISAAVCDINGNQLTTSITTTPCTSFGTNDGVATLTKNSPSVPAGYTYEYYITQGGSTVQASINSTSQPNTVVVSNLAAGNYQFVMRYAQQPDCMRQIPFTISQPLRCNIADSNNVTVAVNTTTYGDSNGSANISISTPIISGAKIEYRISTSISSLSNAVWQQNSLFNNLAVGSYYYEVRYPDYSYCSYTGADKIFTISHVCPTVSLSFTTTDNGSDITFTWANVTPTPVSYVLDVKRNGVSIYTGQQNTNTYTVVGAQKNSDHTITVSPRFTNCTPTSATSPVYRIVANASCTIPGTMTVVADTSNPTLSRIQWGTSPDAVKYLFSFKKGNDTNFGVEIECLNPYYSMELEKGVPYNFQVRSNCTAIVQGSTNNSGMVLLAYTKYLCAIPTGVTTTELPGGAVRVSCVVPGSSMYYAYRKTNENYPNQDTFIASNSFTFTPETNASYEIRIRSVCTNAEDPTSVYILTAYTRSCPVVQLNSITYTPTADNQSLVVSWASTETSFRCRYKVKGEADDKYSAWQNINQRTFTFTPIANKVYSFQIVTLCGGSPSNDVIADVVLYRCDLVTSLSAGYSEVDSKSVVTWAGKPSAYGYHYQYWKYSTPGVKIESDTDGGASLFNFVAVPNKRYRISVKSLCNGNGINTNSSGYTAIDYTYNTCPLIQVITTTEGLDGETTVSWAGSLMVNSYLYNFSTDDGSESSSGETTDPYFVFEPILNKNYTIEVAAICDEVTTPFKSINYMKSYCPLPIGSITTSENGNLTIAQWSAVPDTEGYQFRYKKKVDTVYTTRTSLTNSITFTPQQGVEYVLGVRAICSASSAVYSNWLTVDSYIKALPGISRWTGIVYSKTAGDNLSKPNLVNNQVQSVYVSGDDVWVGTAHDNAAVNDGIWHLNSTTKFTEQFGTVSGVQSGRQLPNNDVRTVWQSADSLWAGTPNGLWRKDIIPQHTLGSNPVQSLSCLVNSKPRLYVLNKDSGHLFMVDPVADTLLGYIVIPKASYRMRFMKDPADSIDKLYIQNEKNEMIAIVETVSGNLVPAIKNEGGLVVKGDNAYILNFIDSTVSVINAQTNTQLSVYAVCYHPVSHDVADNGNIIVISRVARMMTMIDSSTGIITSSALNSGIPEQVVCVGNLAYIRYASSSSIAVVDMSNDNIGQVSVSGNINYIKRINDSLAIMSANALIIVKDGNIQAQQSGVDFIYGNVGDDGNLYLVHNTPKISSYNISNNSYIDSSFIVSENAYNVYFAKSKAYIVTEKNGVHRLTIWDTITTRVLRVLALVGKVVDMSFVGDKFIYINIENSKNIYIVDAEISSPSDINLDTIAINYPVRNTVYYGSKYYVLHRSGEKVIIINTDNHYLDGFAYLENNSEYIGKLNASGFRYIGGVDNMASIWINGLMRGSVWHGGTWSRGMFTHRDLEPNANDFFDSPTSSATTNYQNGIWLRGMWLSGYFSQYNDRADLSDTGYYQNNGVRSIFMGIKAGNAFNTDSIFGLSAIDLDNVKIDILENPATNDHSYSSLFARRMNKMSSAIVNKPYISSFNGKFVNGIIFDDDKPDTTNRPLASIYSSFGAYFFNKEHELKGDGDAVEAISDAPISVSNALETSVKQGKNTMFTAPDNWQPLFYYYGQAKITNTVFLKNFYNFGKALVSNNGMWRHNHSIYGDGTQFPTNGVTYLGLPYGVSIAQGAANKWSDTDAAGEPRYGGESGTIE